MFRIVSITILLLVLCGAGFGDKITTFTDILQPRGLTVQDERVYVLEKFNVCVYDLDSFALIRKIGKRGQGPGETPFPPKMQVASGIIALNSYGKIILFSSKGEILKEKRINMAMIDNFQFFGQNYLIKDLKRVENGRLSDFILLDKDLKITRSYYRRVLPTPQKIGGKTPVELFGQKVFIRTQGEIAFVVHIFDDISITILDRNGKLLYKIDKKLPKKKIPQAVLDGFVNEFMKKFDRQRQKKIRKLFEFKFPVNYPDIKDLKVSGNKLFMQTFVEENGKCLYYQSDLKGRHFKKIYLPIVKSNLSCFSGNWFYYLIENDETEDWEFHRFKL